MNPRFLFVYILRASAKSDGLPATAPSLIIPAVWTAHPRKHRQKMTNLINGERKARLSRIIKGFIRETRCQFLPRVCLLIRWAQLTLHKELDIGSFEDCNRWGDNINVTYVQSSMWTLPDVLVAFDFVFHNVVLMGGLNWTWCKTFRTLQVYLTNLLQLTTSMWCHFLHTTVNNLALNWCVFLSGTERFCSRSLAPWRSSGLFHKDLNRKFFLRQAYVAMSDRLINRR